MKSNHYLILSIFAFLIFKPLWGHSENRHVQTNFIESLERTIDSILVNPTHYTNDEIEIIKEEITHSYNLNLNQLNNRVPELYKESLISLARTANIEIIDHETTNLNKFFTIILLNTGIEPTEEFLCKLRIMFLNNLVKHHNTFNIDLTCYDHQKIGERVAQATLKQFNASLDSLHEIKRWKKEETETKWSFKKRSTLLLALLLGITITISVGFRIYSGLKSKTAQNQSVTHANVQLQEHLQPITHQLGQLSQRVETAIIENTQAINQQRQAFTQESEIRHREVETLRNNFELFLREFDRIMQSIENDEQIIRNSASFIDHFLPSNISISTIGNALTVASGVITLGQQLAGNGNNNNQNGIYQGSTDAVERSLRVGLL